MLAEASYFLWSQMQPELAALAGNCSYLITSNNSFHGNHANIAGAVMYSTNISSMQLSCAAGPQDPTIDCPEWGGGMGGPPNTVGGAGIVGYGPGLAFPPAEIEFNGFNGMHRQISYISDGSSRVPLPVVNVLDQAANVVKLQPMRANVSVTNVSALANGASLPQLPGQTEASSDANGNINIADLILIATPGSYDLLVALPDFPQVTCLYPNYALVTFLHPNHALAMFLHSNHALVIFLHLDYALKRAAYSLLTLHVCCLVECPVAGNSREPCP